VVQTSSGFHLFQVTETRSGGMQPFRAVREEIRSELLAKKSRENLKRWLAGLKEKSEIRYYWRNLNDRAAG
jgi:parvulin-like peptidyl-prolyl isomerase